MKYCLNCLMPDTKPDLYFNEEGNCSACTSYANRESVNWDKRHNELIELLEKYKSQDGSNWDCVIPVSGGKDSTFQVIKILESGYNPLCVTSTTCDLSDIGRKNIENIKNLGVDYIEFSTNKKLRKKLNKIGLTQIGDISWPEHVSIFTIPIRVAVNYNIPLIIWGENSQNEYGGPAGASTNNVLDRRWLEEFGGMLGMRVSDLAGVDGITKKDIIPYVYPTDEELSKVGVTGLFLGYYLPWDGLTNAIISQAYGFSTYGKAVESNFLDYENLDNYQTGIHDYFKFLKYGFSRATDIACLYVRRGRMKRNEAMRIVRERDGKFPWVYLGKNLKDILNPLDVSIDEFITICDRFTNKKIFKCDNNGDLVKDKNGNLIKLIYDNE